MRGGKQASSNEADCNDKDGPVSQRLADSRPHRRLSLAVQGDRVSARSASELEKHLQKAKQGIKAARRTKFDRDQKRYPIFRHHAPNTKGAYPMPTEIIVALLMAAAFGIFAVTLCWADMQTREPGK
jgi:hypothetical protein